MICGVGQSGTLQKLSLPEANLFTQTTEIVGGALSTKGALWSPSEVHFGVIPRIFLADLVCLILKVGSTF